MGLLRSQLLALENVTKYAKNYTYEAKLTIYHILKMSNISEKTFENAVDKLKAHARIGLHFHPDRPVSSIKSIAEALLESVPSDFRGLFMPSLAKRIGKNNVIDASQIGAAVWDLTQNLKSWSDRGTYEEVLQELKLLWHVLVRYGKPLNESSDFTELKEGL